MNHARTFEEKTLVSADSDDIDLNAIADSTDKNEDALDKETTDSLCTFIKEKLGSSVSEVSTSERLVNSPAMIVNSDKMMTVQMRKMMKTMQQQQGNDSFGTEPPAKLQINPRHTLVKNLANLKDSNQELAGMICEQLFDNSRIAAGLLEDPSTMIQRNYKILEQLSSK